MDECQEPTKGRTRRHRTVDERCRAEVGQGDRRDVCPAGAEAVEGGPRPGWRTLTSPSGGRQTAVPF